ncbi:hypothetical protein LCGC14_0987860 [marine sediment metagenome]|uniref:Uncharacterized protein n=1 Tax=marine sediment metagenome TaxID=412755 RepID=A0A0F9NTD8_9ZZZZ
MDETWIGRCKGCGFEGRIKPVKEIIDEDCELDVFYCPICGEEVGTI